MPCIAHEACVPLWADNWRSFMHLTRLESPRSRITGPHPTRASIYSYFIVIQSFTAAMKLCLVSLLLLAACLNGAAAGERAGGSAAPPGNLVELLPTSTHTLCSDCAETSHVRG
jgi:hypothetical protein